MQNVAWATISVKRPSVDAGLGNAELRAMPVTMPGRAIGSTMRKLDRVAAEEPEAMHGE